MLPPPHPLHPPTPFPCLSLVQSGKEANFGLVYYPYGDQWMKNSAPHPPLSLVQSGKEANFGLFW